MATNKKTLVIVTKPLSMAPKELCRLALTQADKVVLTLDGVFSRPADNVDEGYGLPGGHRAVHGDDPGKAAWPGNWAALDEDARARGVEMGCPLVDYAGLVTEIENHDKIITL